jgi:hypothetical protein
MAQRFVMSATRVGVISSLPRFEITICDFKGAPSAAPGKNAESSRLGHRHALDGGFFRSGSAARERWSSGSQVDADLPEFRERHYGADLRELLGHVGVETERRLGLLLARILFCFDSCIEFKVRRWSVR